MLFTQFRDAGEHHAQRRIQGPVGLLVELLQVGLQGVGDDLGDQWRRRPAAPSPHEGV
ncbi:hypothetical protein V7R84_07980 [Arachnia propionica]|uniref:hypothetical protein n=1 Tax=Arachnia propionica TaxID=1750 RepID=UPI0030D0285B